MTRPLRNRVVLSLCMLVAACGSGKQTALLQLAPAEPEEYVIQPNDELDVRFFYNEHLNQQLPVRPDGRISLPLAHEIMAAGRTPAELTEVLTEAYSKQIRKPAITVIVRTFNSQQVFVSGAVKRPSLVELRGAKTVLQAIAVAGGANDTARLTDVVLIRRGDDGTPQTVTLNLKKALTGKDPTQDVMLKQHDIIHVPRTRITKVNQWVEQFITNMLPIRVSASFSYRLNDQRNTTEDEDPIVTDPELVIAP